MGCISIQCIIFYAKCGTCRCHYNNNQNSKQSSLTICFPLEHISRLAHLFTSKSSSQDWYVFDTYIDLLECEQQLVPWRIHFILHFMFEIRILFSLRKISQMRTLLKCYLLNKRMCILYPGHGNSGSVDYAPSLWISFPLFWIINELKLWQCVMLFIVKRLRYENCYLNIAALLHSVLYLCILYMYTLYIIHIEYLVQNYLLQTLDTTTKKR